MEEIKPIRIQRSRKVKQVSPNGLPIVYVGRPGKWGNPYKVGDNKEMNAFIKLRSTSIALFEIYATEMLVVEPTWVDELKGKNLSCWCAEDEKCHADFLLKIANQ